MWYFAGKTSDGKEAQLKKYQTRCGIFLLEPCFFFTGESKQSRTSTTSGVVLPLVWFSEFFDMLLPAEHAIESKHSLQRPHQVLYFFAGAFLSLVLLACFQDMPLDTRCGFFWSGSVPIFLDACFI